MILDACSQSKVEWATQIQILQASKIFTTSIRLQSSGRQPKLDQEKVFVLIASNALSSYYSSGRELGRPLYEVFPAPGEARVQAHSYLPAQVLPSI